MTTPGDRAAQEQEHFINDERLERIRIIAAFAYQQQELNNAMSQLLAKNTQCSICLEEGIAFHLFRTSCNHFFHVNCIREWLCSKWGEQVVRSRINACPNCRQNIDMSVFIKCLNSATYFQKNYQLYSMIRNISDLKDPVDPSGMTMMHCAAALADIEMLKLLCFLGVPVDLETAKGFTSLFGALLSKNSTAVQTLVDAGANVNFKAPGGLSPLQFAVMLQNQEAVELLLRARCDLNEQIEDGSTPILSATEEGNINIMRLLLEAGANPNIQLVNGLTALDKAQINRNQEAIDLLIAHGARTGIEVR